MAVSTDQIYQAGMQLNELRMSREHLVAALLMLLAEASNGGGSGSGNASASNQTQIIDILQDNILPALQNISIDADTVNLNTDGLETLITQIKAQLPATLGTKTAANSLSVALAADAGLPAGSNTLGSVNVLSQPLPTGAATDASIIALLTRRVDWVNRSGTTSATPGTWTTVMAANAYRVALRIHNPLTNTSGDLQIAYTIGGSPVRTVTLSPGGTFEESLPFFNISGQTLSVRSTTASLPFDAVEA